MCGNVALGRVNAPMLMRFRQSKVTPPPQS
ncbi:hypothetical protein ABIF86_000413 [Bradyrhizobium japonicum]